MVLDFGLIGNRENVLSSDYKSASSWQLENLNYLFVTSAVTYETLKTVTTGKTFYLTTLVLSGTVSAQLFKLATGAAASEVDFMTLVALPDETLAINFDKPIKFQSGTRISAYAGGANDAHISIVGWEE